MRFKDVISKAHLIIINSPSNLTVLYASNYVFLQPYVILYGLLHCTVSVEKIKASFVCLAHKDANFSYITLQFIKHLGCEKVLPTNTFLPVCVEKYRTKQELSPETQA